MKKLNKSNLKRMIEINMLYVNPTLTSKIYKGKKGLAEDERNLTNVAKKIFIKTAVVMSVVMILVYGNFFFMVDFSKMAYILDTSVILFLIINVVSGISSYFNVFYESHDVEYYMTLPVTPKEVYLSKLIPVLCTTIPMSVPYIPLFIFFFVKNGYGIALGIIYSILNTALLLLFTVAIQVLIAGIMASFSSLSNKRKAIEIFANVLSSVLAVAIILYIQMKTQIDPNAVISEKQIKGPISGLLLTGTGEFIFAGILLAVILIVYFGYISRIAYGFYETVRKGMLFEGEKKAKRNMTKNEVSYGRRSKKKALLDYHLSFLKEQSIISTSVLLPGIMPIVMMASFLITSSGEFVVNSNFELAMVASVIGMSMAVMIGGNGVNLGSLIYSIEGEDYEYIKSLPIDRKKYFRFKQIFSTITMGILPVVISAGFLVYLGGAITIPVMLISYFAIAYKLTGLWMVYDLNHLMVERENISELYGRLSKALNIIIMTVYVVLFAIVIAILSIGGRNLLSVAGIVLPILIFVVLFVIEKSKSKKVIKKNK